jgi:hypothetical protein
MRLVMIGLALSLIGGAVHAQYHTSSQYCDPLCLERHLGYDCSYHNYAQCWASSSGVGGICVDYPFLSMCARGAATPHGPVRPSRDNQAY